MFFKYTLTQPKCKVLLSKMSLVTRAPFTHSNLAMKIPSHVTMTMECDNPLKSFYHHNHAYELVSGCVNSYVSIFVSFPFISHVSISISSGCVSSDDNNRVCSRETRFQREHILISTDPRGSERSGRWWLQVDIVEIGL